MLKLLLTVAILFNANLFAQDVSLALQKKPVTDPVVTASKWAGMHNSATVSFANSNVRYSRDEVPDLSTEKSATLVAWKGEKVHTQVLLWSSKALSNITIDVSDLRSGKGDMISKANFVTGFVGFVITDEYTNGCGYRQSKDFDSSLVADPINTSITKTDLEKNTVQPIWLSINVPTTAKPGNYIGSVTIHADKAYKLSLNIKVLDKTLPPPSQWAFNLDFWQHPAAIARVHGVKLWSDEHFAFMKKYYTMLAAAGQKNITASIVNEPWGHQTYDDFPSLITWTKKRDGSWQYDYTLFDKYVAFVMSCGIKARINCYSMVPWKIEFKYYDEGVGKDTVFTGDIGSEAYNAFWRNMLTDFTRHLKTKGWFDITAIAMDERPMEAMQAVIKLLKDIDSGWKIALAGDYHPEIEKDIYDYCVASRWQFPSDTLELRRQQNKLSTWYTCCAEKYPNGFTFSPPAEHVWLGWYTAAKNMNGYLRWAFNSWPANPLQDSRFTAWPAGDTYQVYPGPLTSIRFEKLIEGIQDFEKINILKKEYGRKGDTQKLKALEQALTAFDIEKLSRYSAEDMLVPVKGLINE